MARRGENAEREDEAPDGEADAARAPTSAAADERGGSSRRSGDTAPLADRMRPRTLEEVVGQDAAVGPHSLVAEALRAGRVPSLVLWGPPGSGKTTIARALAAGAGGE